MGSKKPQMTEDDKVALKKEFKQYMSDVVFAIGVAGLSIIAIVMIYSNDVPILEQSTEVVCGENK